MKGRKVRVLYLTAMLLCLAAVTIARDGDNPANPTLTERRFQASQLAVFFPVDPDLARRWTVSPPEPLPVPPTFP